MHAFWKSNFSEFDPGNAWKKASMKAKKNGKQTFPFVSKSDKKIEWIAALGWKNNSTTSKFVSVFFLKKMRKLSNFSCI